MSGTIAEADVFDALRDVIDPELGVNIVDLGLVYRVATGDGAIAVDMTMTTPSCPLGDYLKDESRSAIRRRFSGVGTIEINLVWSPPWSAELIREEGRRALGWPEEERKPGYSAWTPSD